MRGIITGVLFFLGSTAWAQVQTDSLAKSRIPYIVQFYARVSPDVRPYAPYIFQSLGDSTLNLKRRRSSEVLIRMPVEQLEFVRIRRKGKIGRGILLGMLGGIATGAIWGQALGDDRKGGLLSLTADTKSTVLGTVCIIPGAIIGAILGSSSKKIVFNKSVETYQAQRETLRQYVQRAHTLE